MTATTASIDFCGELAVATPDSPLTIGRDADIQVDDNPYLHRKFLRVEHLSGLWWLINTGSQLNATVADEAGLLQAWLAPGGRLPLVFPRTVVWFTAGPTTYELTVDLDASAFTPVVAEHRDAGATTIGRTTLTPDQRLLVVALCEPVLRRGERGAGRIPTNADAARRLGWTSTKFNRKLDNVCQKLARCGVRGVHGSSEELASNRRARLVEYVMAARVVDRSDLALLDGLTASAQS